LHKKFLTIVDDFPRQWAEKKQDPCLTFSLYKGEDNKKKEFVRKNRYVGMKK